MADEISRNLAALLTTNTDDLPFYSGIPFLNRFDWD